MDTVLLDGSGIIAYLDSRDQYHRRAVPVFRGLLRRRAPLATTSYILSEVLTYAKALGGRDPAAQVMEFFLALLASRRLRLYHLTAGEFMDASQLFLAGPEKSLSFPDASLAWLARRSGARSVFGYDRDFAGQGFELVG